MRKKYVAAITNLFRCEKGMEAVENIVIIAAFAVMVGVFLFVVLNGGKSIAEKGRDVVHAGVQQVTSDLEVSGPIVVTSTDDGAVKNIIFAVKKASDGIPVDMTPCDGTGNANNKIAVNLLTATDQLDNIKWNKEAIGPGNNNNMLENGEQFQITIDLKDLGYDKSLTTPLGVRSQFSLQIKPVNGAMLINIQRVLPSQLEPVMDLH
jgi:flagellin FlaB